MIPCRTPREALIYQLTAHSNGPWSGQEGRGGPSPLARPRLRRPRPPLRTPRTRRETCCRGRCDDVQHDGQHCKVLVRTPQNFYEHVYFRGGATTAVAAPGLACDLGGLWTCWLRAAVAVSIHTITASPGRPDGGRGTKGAKADTPGLAGGCARGLDAYLWLLNALTRAYRPHHPPAPALSISNSAARGAKETESGWRHYDAF